MKIIFLDIDGVLNSHSYLSRTDIEDRGIYANLDPGKVELLKGIVDLTGASIVLSSSWRACLDEDLQPIGLAAEDFMAVFSENGLTLYDKTAYLFRPRGAEVREWLSRNPAVSAFVILDDDVFADWRELSAHWVKTSYYTGLTAQEAARAVSLLNAESAL